MLKIIIIIAVLIIIYFIYSGFVTRCPNCGERKLHKKTNRKNELNNHEDIRQLQEQLRHNLYIETGGRFGNPEGSFGAKELICNKCKTIFKREEAIYWGGIAMKFGEDTAFKEYKKLKNNG